MQYLAKVGTADLSEFIRKPVYWSIFLSADNKDQTKAERSLLLAIGRILGKARETSLVATAGRMTQAHQGTTPAVVPCLYSLLTPQHPSARSYILAGEE